MTAFDEAFQMLKQNFRISNLPPHIRARNLPDMSPQRFIDEGLHRVGAKKHTRELDIPEKSEDEIESDMEEERQMQERKRIHHLLQNQGNQIPDFGDEDAREGELETAERTRIMNQGEGSQQPPMSRGRGGMPVMSPDGRPKIPRDIFGKAWDFLKAKPIDMHEYPPDSGNFMTLQDMLMARNADAKRNMQANPPQPTSQPKPSPQPGYSGWM